MYHLCLKAPSNTFDSLSCRYFTIKTNDICLLPPLDHIHREVRTSILSKFLDSALHPAVAAPSPLKNSPEVSFPFSIQSSHVTVAMAKSPPLGWKKVPRCPTGWFPFQAGVLFGRFE